MHYPLLGIFSAPMASCPTLNAKWRRCSKLPGSSRCPNTEHTDGLKRAGMAEISSLCGIDEE